MNRLLLNRAKEFLPIQALLLGLLVGGLTGASNIAALPRVDPEKPLTHVPYARIAEKPSDYRGPGRSSNQDIAAEEINLGLMVPLEGLQAEAGRALELAARMAIEEVNAEGGYRGRMFHLLTRSSSVPWGKASSEIVNLIYSDRVVALVTPLDGAVAHLAEQVANKAGVPVVSLAPDSTTTAINLPWIFRSVPSDKDQAELFRREILEVRRHKRVALIWQDNRDGRLGESAFRSRGGDLAGFRFLKLERNPTEADLLALKGKLRRGNFESVVLWTEPNQAARIVKLLEDARPTAEIFLSLASAQPPFFDLMGGGAANVHVISPPKGEARSAAVRRFKVNYLAKAGTLPTPMVRATFDAILLVARAVQSVGPNRTRLRDYLASGSRFIGSTGAVTFDSEGNLKESWSINTIREK